MLESSRQRGWVLEPDAKVLFKDQGFDIPEHILTDSVDQAFGFLEKTEGPVAAKAVSSEILHKTEHKAVVTGISTREHLAAEVTRLLTLTGCKKVLVEQMVSGVEVIIGAKNDRQFGPVVLFGPGGTAVEIYNDTAVRMAPLKTDDVVSMVDALKAAALIKGYRGGKGVNMVSLTRTLVAFSHMVVELGGRIDSIDLNPVICTEDKCIIADARIVL